MRKIRWKTLQQLAAKRNGLVFGIALLSLIVISACNPWPVKSTVAAGVTQPVAVASVESAAPPGLTLKQQIALLEKSGQLIALDRSDSLLGPDLNNNGVRDDIEAYINSLRLTLVQTKAALQSAKAMQMSLAVDTTDKVGLQRVGVISMASSNCLFDQITDVQLANQISLAIESKTANTKIRVMKYLAYNSARSGSVTRFPSGDTCEK